jgi:hypothetical protein
MVNQESGKDSCPEESAAADDEGSLLDPMRMRFPG